MPCGVGGGNEMFLVYAAEENDLLAESGGFFNATVCRRLVFLCVGCEVQTCGISVIRRER